MRRMILVTLVAVFLAAAAGGTARAAGSVGVQALLVLASKGPGGSDPRLAEYEATLKRTLRFDTFKLAGQGTAALGGGKDGATVALGGGHRLQLSGGERSGGGIKVRVTWTNGSREMMNTSLTLRPGIPAVLGSGGDGEVPVVLVIAR